MKKRSNKPVVETVDSDDDSSEEGKKDTTKKTTKPKKSEGYNWAAICIMLLFLVPSAFALVIALVDYAYPEQAKARLIRDRVVRCYEAADPKKLDNIDAYMKKYKGREGKLFTNLRMKYEQVPECAGIDR